MGLATLQGSMATTVDRPTWRRATGSSALSGNLSLSGQSPHISWEQNPPAHLPVSQHTQAPPNRYANEYVQLISIFMKPRRANSEGEYIKSKLRRKPPRRTRSAAEDDVKRASGGVPTTTEPGEILAGADARWRRLPYVLVSDMGERES